MSGTGRHAAPAAHLESAGFLRLLVRADGDALAAAGLLARACADRGTPFQVTVGRTVGERTDRVRDCEGTTISVGPTDADVPRLDGDGPATFAAIAALDELGVEPDPTLALAGTVAAGREPGSGPTASVLEAARERGVVERRPGVAVPTADLADGLAHSTACRLPYSGDLEATRESLADVGGLETPDAETRKRVASLAAIDAVGSPEASERAATAVGSFLAPLSTPAGPFETVGGHADVLEALARVEPGSGVALALGAGGTDAALSAWREHGRLAHRALETATTGRYDGLYVLGVDGAVGSVARLAVDYRSPEPAVLAVGEGEAAVATSGEDVPRKAIEAAAREIGADYDVGPRRGYLRYGPETTETAVISAVRGQL